MVEWLPFINTLVRLAGMARREANKFVSDANSLLAREREHAAMIQIARLRFDAPDMRAIVDKISDGNGSESLSQELNDALDATADEVTHTMESLSFSKDFGELILERTGLSVASAFQDVVYMLKIDIRTKMRELAKLNPSDPEAQKKADYILDQIKKFNSTLETLHQKVFATGRSVGVTTHARDPAKVRPAATRSRKKLIE